MRHSGFAGAGVSQVDLTLLQSPHSMFLGQYASSARFSQASFNSYVDLNDPHTSFIHVRLATILPLPLAESE